MKVLVASDVMEPGGVDGYIRAVACALRAGGHEPELVVDSASASRVAAVAREDGLRLHGLRLHHRSHDDAVIARDCHELLDGRAPDGLHVACGIPWSCLALRRIAVARNIPLLVTEQYVPDDLVLSANQRAAILGSYGHARRVIFVSEGNRRRMAMLVGLSGVQHAVIPNGVAVDGIACRSPSFAVRRAGLSARRPRGGMRVMTAGRLTRQKGLDVLIDAVGLLPRGTLQSVDVFGDGPAGAELRRRSHDVGVDALVRFRPWSTDVVSEMSSHDLFVLPSNHEGMPFVLLEAMAAGIPTIATDTPGAVEALDGGCAGTLVPRGDPGALARALTFLAVPDVLTRAVVARGRARAQYNRDELMSRTVSLWRDGSDTEGAR
jgi:glycosyltransferase involved in cell wall biosynthesis